MNRNFLVVVFSIVLFMLAVPSVQAQSNPEGWYFRAFGGFAGRVLETDNVTFDDPVYGTSSTEVDGSTLGFGVDVERRFSKLLGLDMAVSYANMDVVFNQSLTTDKATDTLSVMPFWIALNFHVVNTEKVDFWVAPQIAYVMWNDPLTFNVPGEEPYAVQTSGAFGIGLAMGLDYWLSENGGLNFAFRFVDADANDNLPVDPTFITFGYTWRF